MTTFLGITNSSKVTFLLGVTVFLVEVTCFARSTYVKDADTESASTEGADIEAAFIKGVCIRDASICASNACIGA